MCYSSLITILLLSLAHRVCYVKSFKVKSSPRYIQSKSRLTRCLTSENSNIKSPTPHSAPPRLAYAAAWVGLTTYAFGFSPGGSPEAAAIDSELIAKMISTPFDGSVSPIFVALFNSLGIIPVIYSSLLLPGSKNQSPPAAPFLVASFALGFFGLGPYLALRQYRDDPESTEVKMSELSFFQTAFENKLTAADMAAFASYLLFYAVTGMDLTSNLQGYQALFLSQRLVNVSTLDFTILILCMGDVIDEDMRRRGVQGSALKYAVVPVFGPIMWLLTRPSLQ
jgi:hypothetical protein